MKLLCLPRFGRKGASSRLRTHQYLPHFKSAGIQVDVIPLLSDELLARRYSSGSYNPWTALGTLWRRARRMMGASAYDLVWIEKEALPWLPSWVERPLLSGARYCLDFDDATFHRYDNHDSRLVRCALGGKIDRLMSGAQLITVGNEYLSHRAERAGAPWIEYVPTVVDTNRYPIRHREGESGPVRIVWIGTPVTARYLAVVREPLERLSDEFDFILRVIGGGPQEFGRVNVESVPWSESTEGHLIAECDIGIMPIPDLPWERGKCAYKLIQYMACGLPTVGSPVGANRVVVQEGRTGWLAETPEEWVVALRRLLADPEQRRTLGSHGRDRVEEAYSVATHAPRLVRFLKEAAGGNRA